MLDRLNSLNVRRASNALDELIRRLSHVSFLATDRARLKLILTN